MEGNVTKQLPAEVATGLFDLPEHVIVENILAELIPSSLSGDFSPKATDLRDILSFASTCTRTHELASHPSLWRDVDAAVFRERFADARKRGGAPPPLPLGAVHCGVFRAGNSAPTDTTASLVESLRGLTDVQIYSAAVSPILGRFVRAVSSLPRLSVLRICGDTMVRSFAGVKLSSSQSLGVLSFDCRGTDVSGFLSANSFPSLTSLRISSFGEVDAVAAATVVRSCPALEEIFIHCRVTGSNVVSIAMGCPSLRKITVMPPTESLSVDDATSAVPCPNVRELLVISPNCAVAGCFLALFPNLVRLGLLTPKEAGDDLKEIGGMMDLQHLALDGTMYVGDSHRRLVSLVNHPMASGRRSLESLTLRYYRCDIGDFLSSPWCFCLVNLSLVNCTLDDYVLAKLNAAAHGTALSSTLRSLTVQSTEVDGGGLGRFVSALPSLTDLTVSSPKGHFDVNGFLCVLGRSSLKLARLRLVAPSGGDRIYVAPLLGVISAALGVCLSGNVDQAALEAVASSCGRLCRLSVHTPDAVIRPQSFMGVFTATKAIVGSR